jgi:Ca2+-binding RTX toxin-like protein
MLLTLPNVFGATLPQIQGGLIPLGAWQRLIVQAGSTAPGPDGTTSAFNYDAANTGFAGDASASTVVIGGGGTNTMKGSSSNDYLVGGKGQNTFEGGGGQDILIGGPDGNTYLALSGPTSTSSVIFLGNGADNLADYSNVTTALHLTLSVDNIDPHVDQLVDASGAMDSFLDVQNFKLSQNQDTLTIAAKWDPAQEGHGR